MKEIFIFLAGAAVGVWMSDSNAQSYVVSNPQGYNQGTIQIQGNQAQYVTPQGNFAATATVYPKQIVMPSGAAIGVPTGYTVPMSPPSPPSPRVLQ